MSKIYTEFMQELLDSITKGMAHLIDMNEKCQESEHVSMPAELFPNSQTMQTTLMDVVKFMRNSVNGEDAVFDRDIVGACDRAEKGAQQVVDSMEHLTKGLRDPKYHSLMNEGANNMMHGTVQMLDIYDDRDKRIIVAACNAAKDKVSPLSQVDTISALVAHVKPMNPKLVQVAKLSSERCNLLKLGPHRQATEAANKVVTTSSVGLVSSLKAFCQNKGDEDAAVSKEFYIKDITAALDRIIFLVNMRYFLAETFCPGGDFASAVANVLDILEKGKMGDAFDPITQDALMTDYQKVIDEAKRIADNCDDPEDAERLRKRIEGCEALIKEVDSLAKQLQSNPDDQELKNKYKETCDKLHQEIKDLADDCTRCLAKQREKAVINAMVVANELMDRSRAQDVPGVDALKPEFAQACSDVHAAAISVGSDCADGPKSQAVVDAAENFQSYSPVLVSAARLAAKTGNAADQKHADLVKGEWDRRLATVVAAMDVAQGKPGLAAAALERRLADAMEKAKAAAQSGDEAAFKSHRAEVKHILDRVNDVLDKEIEACEDPALGNELKSAKADIAAAQPKYFAALDAYKASPTAANRATLEAAEKTLSQAVNRAIVSLGGENLEELERRLKEEEAERERKRLEEEERLRQQMLELQRQEEERKRKEEEARLAAEEARRLAEIAEREAADAAAREKARRDAEEAERLAAELAAQKARIIEEDKVIVYDAPEKLNVGDNDIGKAAQDLHDTANKWDDSENDLIAIFKKISENFAKMSELQNQSTCKAELIALSKEISADAKKAAKIANMFTKECTDRRLTADLANTVGKIETIGTQLRMVATVKASMPDDKSADEQMTVCAKNLMEACKECVGGAHACSIKSPKGSTPNIKWRKMVYKQ